MSRITAILQTLVKNFASLEEDSDSSYWWGHDTNLGDQEEAFKQAEQAITDLLNEAITETINQYKYPHDAEVADDIATALRTKLGLTTKEDN